MVSFEDSSSVIEAGRWLWSIPDRQQDEQAPYDGFARVPVLEQLTSSWLAAIEQTTSGLLNADFDFALSKLESPLESDIV